MQSSGKAGNCMPWTSKASRQSAPCVVSEKEDFVSYSHSPQFKNIKKVLIKSSTYHHECRLFPLDLLSQNNSKQKPDASILEGNNFYYFCKTINKFIISNKTCKQTENSLNIELRKIVITHK